MQDVRENKQLGFVKKWGNPIFLAMVIVGSEKKSIVIEVKLLNHPTEEAHSAGKLPTTTMA